MGFTQLVMGRIHKKDKDQRTGEKNLDFVCIPRREHNTSADPKDRILSHVLWDAYVSPQELCFDESTDYCNTGPPGDVNSASAFGNTLIYKFQNNNYKGDHLCVLVGNDFGFKNANRNYNGMDYVM